MIPEDVDWTHFCAVAFRCRIAPVLYQCVRRASATIPADVLDWFRVQHYETVARNMALFNDLREVLGWFAEGSIPAIVLKGPALADLGLGAARVSSDLDVLIHKTDLPRADAILRSHGHRAWPGPPHDYHIRYSRPAPSGARVVEVHYDIFDRPRFYRPDIDGIWERSRETTLSDVQVRVPDLWDHILLTIMQLPHHHWAMRLVVDLWQIALRWREQIDWLALLERAGHWQMRVLTRSALHTLWALFDVPVSPAVIAMSNPSGYLERMQWGATKCAIVEQLEHPFRPRVTLVVPFLMVDQAKRVPAILFRRSLGSGGSPEESLVTKATRRSMAGVAALPAISRVLLASFGQSTLRPGWPR
ncbi:MAG TPA: nucleotidyltransferase family protein [Thermoleophilia bacterium]|nr:nucleotidyltransferase family protein [Thermoleophilia bacterium]